MKTRVYTLWLALALACTAVQADPPEGGDERASASGKSQETPSPSTAGKQRRQKPAGSFTPSEKVGADSAVSLPVDI